MRPSNLSSEQDRLMAWLWLLAAAVLPLAIFPAQLLHNAQSLVSPSPRSTGVPPAIDPELVWIFPKVVLLLIFSVIGLLWLRREFRFDAYAKLVIAYLATFLLSAVVSGDEFQYLLLGSQGRMDGVFYAVGLAVFALVGYFLTLKHGRLFSALYVALGFGSVAEVLLLTLQRLGLDPLGPITRGESYKDIVTGTIGNPGMLAGMLLPVAILSVGLLTAERTSRHLKYWSFVTAVISAAGIGLTGNKSSFYGLIIFLFIYVLLQRYRRTFLIAATVIVVMFLSPSLIPNHTTYNHPLTPTASIATRPALWKLTLNAILHTKGQPLIGAGPDGLRLTVLKNDLIEEMLEVYRISERWPQERQITSIRPVYSPQDPLRSHAYAVTFSDDQLGKLYRVNVDKAHNMFLDRAVRSGVVSAFIWLALYLLPAFRLVRSRNPVDNAIALALGAVFVYYLFWFPVPQVEPLHVALLSCAWGLTRLSVKEYGQAR